LHAAAGPPSENTQPPRARPSPSIPASMHRLLLVIPMLVPASGAAAVAQQQQLHAAGSAARPPPPHVGPRPEPAQPHIAAGYPTSNIFWPGDTDANGTVYQCAYIPTLVLANHTRLIAHGNCGTEANSCNGLHIQQSRAASASATLEAGAHGLPPGTPGNPIQEGKICQKHSDDGGKTWSKLRLAVRGVDTGKIVWDDLRKRLVMHYTTQAKSVACPDCPGGGAVYEYISTDLGTRSHISRRFAHCHSATRGPRLSLTRTFTTRLTAAMLTGQATRGRRRAASPSLRTASFTAHHPSLVAGRPSPATPPATEAARCGQKTTKRLVFFSHFPA
jgi:hypothetical protein